MPTEFYKTASSPPWGRHRSQHAVVLDSSVAVLAFLPMFATLAMTLLAVGSMFGESHGKLSEALPFVVFPLAYAGAAVAFHRMLLSRTGSTTWRWALVFILVTVAASTPATWTLSAAVVDEWCETEPGGRGYSGDATLAEIPAFCR